jgi:hypothetical protein
MSGCCHGCITAHVAFVRACKKAGRRSTCTGRSDAEVEGKPRPQGISGWEQASMRHGRRVTQPCLSLTHSRSPVMEQRKTQGCEA